jgi:hypothetical protein
MFELPQVGVEYGTDWLLREFLRANIDTASTLETFEQSVADYHPESVKIGWIEYDTLSALKGLDPVSWDIAHSESIDGEVSDGNLITFDNGSTYYSLHGIEDLIAENAS